MHRLLRRQLKRHLEGGEEAIPEEWLPLLNAVSDAYQQADRDRRMIEHSLELMSQELTERNRALQNELCEHQRTEEILQQEKAQQAALITRLEEAQTQLIQSEKMASIGQLAAGVAHEINNPIGYVNSNLNTLDQYVKDLLTLLAGYERLEPLLGEVRECTELRELKRRVDLDFLREDLPQLLHESIEGATRVRQIVQSLKEFSHAGQQEDWVEADLVRGLENTLNVAWNELKYKAEVIRDYGEIPPIECLPMQLNQVFMNLLVNAADAIEEKGTITLRTRPAGEEVFVEVADSGQGISPTHLNRLFEPFFTTKPVGKGTGLGLSVSYNIVRKHGGQIEVESEPGRGTLFRIRLPRHRPPAAGEAAEGPDEPAD